MCLTSTFSVINVCFAKVQIAWKWFTIHTGVDRRDKGYLPLRFFSTTTIPLPSAAGWTPTVFLCTKPLKRKEFLAFRLLGSYHTNRSDSDIEHITNVILKSAFYQLNPAYRVLWRKNTITHSAICLPIPLNEETGTVPDDHPLQMGRHDEPVQKITLSYFTQSYNWTHIYPSQVTDMT